MKRRDFIKCSLCSVLAAGYRGPSLAYAGGSAGNGRVLILMEFQGGLDPLHAFPLIGSAAGTLQALRPNLFVDPIEALQFGTSTEIGLHKNWKDLSTSIQLSDEMRLVGLAGFPITTGSHATAQRFYSLGANTPTVGADEGWIGRLMRAYDLSSYQVWGLLPGKKVDFNAAGAAAPVLTSNLQAYVRNNRIPALGGQNESTHSDQIAELILQRENPSIYAERILRDGFQAMNQSLVKVASVAAHPTVGLYPNSTFGKQACNAAQIVSDHLSSGQSGSLIVYLQMPGCDTHGNQLSTLPPIVDDTSKALAGLVTDLRAMGAWKNTVICKFSEFSRTVRENAPHIFTGSDHGEATYISLLGGALNKSTPQVIGNVPDSAMLTNYNHLPAFLDPRNVFAELVDWLGFDSQAVFTEPYVKQNLQLMA